MIAQQDAKVREKTVNFCLLVLHHHPEFSMTDIFEFDIEARDILAKEMSRRVWESINLLSADVKHKFDGIRQDTNLRFEESEKSCTKRCSDIDKTFQEQNIKMLKATNKMITINEEYLK